MRYRILISDDEVDIVEMLTGFFRSKGYEVFSAYNGVETLKLAELQPDILTSKYGKTKCATAKVLASLLSAVFITTLVVIFNLLIAVAIYGTEGLDCSILFAPIDFLEGYSR